MKDPYELAKNILKSAADGPDQDRSSGSFTSIDLYGAAVHEKGMEAASCSTFHLENESGTGDITLYHVFPGIELVYNDMHMEYCNKNQEPASDVVEINYCKEGRSSGLHKSYASSGTFGCSIKCIAGAPFWRRRECCQCTSLYWKRDRDPCCDLCDALSAVYGYLHGNL